MEYDFHCFTVISLFIHSALIVACKKFHAIYLVLIFKFICSIEVYWNNHIHSREFISVHDTSYYFLFLCFSIITLSFQTPSLPHSQSLVFIWSFFYHFTSLLVFLSCSLFSFSFWTVSPCFIIPLEYLYSHKHFQYLTPQWWCNIYTWVQITSLQSIAVLLTFFLYVILRYVVTNLSTGIKLVIHLSHVSQDMLWKPCTPHTGPHSLICSLVLPLYLVMDIV